MAAVIDQQMAARRRPDLTITPRRATPRELANASPPRLTLAPVAEDAGDSPAVSRPSSTPGAARGGRQQLPA